MKRLFSLIAVGIILLGLCACGAEGAPGDHQAMRTIVDGSGRTVEIPNAVESVVCVGVGALRYTCYMQGQDLVVGVEDYETKEGTSRLYNYVNFERFRNLPIIGTNGEPFVEEIIRVGPQVIVLSQSASVEADDLQSKTGIPVVVVPGSDTTLDTNCYDTLRILGELYGREERTRELTAYLRGIEEDLGRRTEGIENKPTAYVCGVSFKGVHGFEGTEAGYGPFVLIKARNLADTTGQTGAFDMDIEQVLQWNPDVIFVDYNGLDLINEAYRNNPGFFENLTAVQEGRVYSQISFRSYASNLDTALADAYYAAYVLYPDRFADVDLEAKIGEIFEMLLGTNPYPDLKEAGYAFRTIQIGK